MPWPVRTPQPTVAARAIAGRQERPLPDRRARSGSRRVGEERLADPDRPDASDADHGQDGDDDVRRQDHAAALPTNARRAQSAGSAPSTAKRVERQQDRDRCQRRTSVISKTMPDRLSGDRGEEEAGDEPEQEGAARRRPRHPPDERAGQGRRGQQQQRQDDEVAGIEGRRAEERDGGRAEPRLAPVVPGLGRQAVDAGRSPTASRAISVPVLARSAPRTA